jgi:Fic family protein
MNQPYQPPCTLSPAIVNLVARIGEVVGRHSVTLGIERDLRLRRINRIRTVHGSLAIEGNTLSEAQITAILEGKLVMAPPREIQEARNALKAYEQLEHWQPHRQADLLVAHQALMTGLVDDAGRWRSGGVGVMAGDQVLHMAPPADRAPALMTQLLAWLAETEAHPLIASAVFHYEFEFIHPFSDGNGRMGRLWQTLILSRWNPLFADLPVESLVYAHQADYYRAIRASTQQSDAPPFVAFMLERILEAFTTLTPQDAPHVTPQVIALLSRMRGEMSRQVLQQTLGLADREHFRKAYLAPAMAQKLIEMTQPGKPNSRSQRYRLTESGRLALQALQDQEAQL